VPENWPEIGRVGQRLEKEIPFGMVKLPSVLIEIHPLMESPWNGKAGAQITGLFGYDLIYIIYTWPGRYSNEFFFTCLAHA